MDALYFQIFDVSRHSLSLYHFQICVSLYLFIYLDINAKINMKTYDLLVSGGNAAVLQT